MKTKRAVLMGPAVSFDDHIEVHHQANTSRRNHLLYRGVIVTLVVFLFLLFVIRVSQSQGQPRSGYPGMENQDVCRDLGEMGLTSGQMKALNALKNAYMAEAMPLRTELISRRFELRHLIRNPEADPKTLLDQQKKISEVQMKLENLAFSYQMKARSIFTKEQMGRLPQDWWAETGAGSRTEMQKGWWKGPHR